jgi:hypothetical protein
MAQDTESNDLTLNTTVFCTNGLIAVMNSVICLKKKTHPAKQDGSYQ